MNVLRTLNSVDFLDFGWTRIERLSACDQMFIGKTCDFTNFRGRQPAVAVFEGMNR
jgi:hypothetical protein